MPQADDQDREIAYQIFGDIDTAGPEKYLHDRGWTITKAWEWIKPTPDHVVTHDEAFCIGFLIDEWDYGGLAPNQPLTPMPMPTVATVSPWVWVIAIAGVIMIGFAIFGVPQ